MSALATGNGGGRVQRLGSRKFLMIVTAVGFLLSLISPMMMASAQEASAQDWSPPRTVYLPETGHTLDQVFLDQWREGGGASVFGYPITPEITEDDGTIVQYLQYARYEYHPEGSANGNYFELGNIGEELRPFSLQRSVASFTSTGTSEHGGAAAANAEFVNAWMPVEATNAGSNNVRYIEETNHTIRYGFLTFWEQSGGADYLGNPLTEEYIVDGVTYQVFERGQLAWENGKDAWMMPVGEMLATKYKLSQEPVDQGDIPTYSEDLFVPPPTPTPEPEPETNPIGSTANAPADGERWIDIDLGSQYMVAYQGDVPVMETYVSTGRPGFDTPPGTYHIQLKIPMQDMEGVIGGEYYDVPEVPDVMYFTSVGHAIHGAYWHSNFGSVMSHGCVNLPLGTSAWLYDWTPMGARVEIHW